ncbi:MAG: adenosylcobinamide-GDP ribazoletransferase [Candidatus Accumulibacter sp.]|jgi:adenosylcobinamide-GDP ribazoletransferase|nr:adenosylcobinamide-GDP ribazoletransferase [Accumulibacter sp.]
MSLKNELDILVAAIRFFTRLPVPGPWGYDSAPLERAIRYYPAVGIIVGTIGAAVFFLVSAFWTKPVAVLATIAAIAYITGAIHEDGWTDTVDGFGGGWTKDRILEIMRDSRVGSFGVCALTILLLGRFLALCEMDTRLIPVPAALIAGHAFSRLCATFVLGALDYARPDGKAQPFSNALDRREKIFILLSVAWFLLLFIPFRELLCGITLGAVSAWWLARMFQRQIGGYTGDCIGAVQQLSEVMFYIGLLFS